MERMEKASKRVQELETVTNNIQLLGDMLNHYSADTATSSELDVMKVGKLLWMGEKMSLSFNASWGLYIGMWLFYGVLFLLRFFFLVEFYWIVEN